MRRAEVIYRPEAISDLENIFRFVAENTQRETVASRFVARIMARCRKIGDAPHGGRLRDDLAQGLRTVPFERTAVIVYRVTTSVEIINISYGGRDYETLYRQDPKDE
jgi:toxin ParE1/3/4